MAPTPQSRVLVLAALCVALAGCGQKGPLTLPPTDADAPAAAPEQPAEKKNGLL